MENWLESLVQAYGVHHMKDVFYAGLDTSGNLYVFKRRTAGESPGKHGLE